jgi:hypothetical protein
MVMSLFASTAYAAEWVQYASQEGDSSRKWYYDKKSISKTKENHILVLGMGTTNVGSSTTSYEIDCKGSRMRSLNVKSYEKPMAEGKIGYQSDTALRFKPLSEAADLDPHKALLFKLICEQK